MNAGRPVLLGVSGGIAGYKACAIARQLTEAGTAVDVVMTVSAAEFVRPVLFEGLTGRPVLTSLWERNRALAHIHLGRESQLIIVAPATANLLARAAQGIADDLLTAILLAAEAPILAAPAMNDNMFAHPATAANLETLRERGWTLVGPAVGPLAEGPSDRPGRMVEPEEIIARAERIVRAPASRLRGKRVVVTAGPTREPIDRVRVITNPSSGRMGFAVAEVAFVRGADVVLITGPTELPTPPGVELVRIESTVELRDAVAAQLPQAKVLVMAAAPADYRSRVVCDGKLPKVDGSLELSLDPTVDVLESTIDRRQARSVMVGFALEGGDGISRARAKLERKRLDLVVLNEVGGSDGGFAVGTNRVTFITREETDELPVLPKREVAEKLLDRVEGML